MAIVREQYYLNLLKPEYNVLKKAGSLLGYKHTEKTLELMRNKIISKETKKLLSLAATKRRLTIEERKNLSEAHKGKALSDETRKKISEAAKELRGVNVVVEDLESLEGLTLTFNSLKDAGEALGVTRPGVAKALKTGNPLKGRYIVRELEKLD